MGIEGRQITHFTSCGMQQAFGFVTSFNCSFVFLVIIGFDGRVVVVVWHGVVSVVFGT